MVSVSWDSKTCFLPVEEFCLNVTILEVVFIIVVVVVGELKGSFSNDDGDGKKNVT